jgi:hypothetical protein
MQSTYVWSKLNIYGKKVALSTAILLLLSGLSYAQTQGWIRKNNPNYDNRKLSYGFLIGLHTTAFKVKYADTLATQKFDSLYAVEPHWSPGFSLGFIVNYKLGDFFDLRLTPKVAFYEHRLRYIYTDLGKAEPQVPLDEVVETTMVEFPLLLKYKSERRGNIRMYMIGGVKPGIEASGKKDLENITGSLEVKGTSMNLDFGFGFDLYYPLFKFSPEIRFSKGLTNMLDNKKNQFGLPLDKLTTNTITVYLLFQ